MTKARSAAFLFASIIIALLPTMAQAQSSISGIVKDSSGAVMPGATVSVSSDVMIEGTKTATTNGEGRYEIIDLRPGTYVVTATSAGFDTVKQTVQVPANVDVPVDATLKAGAVAETVNVEARTATVDTENAAHPTTLSRQEMDELPTGRYMQSIASYVPGVHLNLPDLGGSQQVEQNYVAVHGNSSVDDSYYLDGLLVNTTYGDGQIQNYIDNAAIQESTYMASNVTADVSGGGMFTNLVPRDGGNQFHLSVWLSGNGGSGLWQAGNLSQSLMNRGLGAQDKVVKIEDYDGAFSGPLIKDKLWFVMTGRKQVTFTQAGASVYPNGAPGIQDAYLYNGTGRLTYQVNQKNKLSAFFERNFKRKGHEIVDGGQTYLPVDPSVASTQRPGWSQYYILQARWTGTLTPKLIVQAGMSIDHLDYDDLYQPGVLQPPGTVANWAGTTQIDLTTLRRYISGSQNNYFQTRRNVFNATGTYVTGSHQIRAGFNDSFGPYHQSEILNGDGYAEFNDGVPTAFVAYNTPYYFRPYLDADLGVFIQDTWKIKRLSITAGVRYEYLAEEIQEENAPAGRFSPARTVPETTCQQIKGLTCWNNFAPRVGAVYDLFGNHKTALKAGWGKYNAQNAYSYTSTFNPMAIISETVPWNFAGLGANCNPVTIEGVPAPNPLCYAVGGFAPQGTVGTTGLCAGCLGASANPTFGAITGVGNGVALNPNWNRPYNYQYSAGVQQELYRGVTLNANWYRRSSYQAAAIFNENAIPLSQWSPYTIDNPLNGTPITLYNLNPSYTVQPAAALYQTNAPQSLVRDVYTGYETQVVARLGRGIFATFGYTLDRQLARGCADPVTTSKTLQDPNTLRYCDEFGNSSLAYDGINITGLGAVSPPWSNAWTGQGSFPIKWGIVISTSFLSNLYQGSYTGADADNSYLPRTISLSATTKYPTGCIGCQSALQTGQTCASAGPTVGCPIDPGLNALQGTESINLVGPGAVRSPRLEQWDVNIKRIFRWREKYSFEPEVEVFNLLNSSAPVAQGTSVGTTVAPYLTPQQCQSTGLSSVTGCGLGGSVTTITNPRLLKLALTIKF